MKVYSCSFFLLFLGILCVIPVQAGKNKGNLSNLVCFVRFLDEDNDEMFEHPFSMYEQLFNDATSGANSVYNYFREASYGQLSWKSSFIRRRWTERSFLIVPTGSGDITSRKGISTT